MFDFFNKFNRKPDAKKEISLQEKLKTFDSKLAKTIESIDEINNLLKSENRVKANEKFKLLVDSINEIESMLSAYGFTGYGGVIEGAHSDIEKFHDVTRRWGNFGYESACLILQEEIKPVLENWQTIVRQYLKTLASNKKE